MVHRTPFFLPLLYSTLTWRMQSVDKTLYLTFDDGPVPGPTDFVLKALKEYEAKATFFCIGENIRRNSILFKEIVRNGHAIGNHTFNHINGWETSADAYYQNIELCRQEIAGRLDAGFDIQSLLFRPPFGRISREQIRRLSAYRIIMWDVLSIDYNINLAPEKCLRNTIAAARPGSIIVFHDSYKAERNLTYALPRFIEHYLDQGFTFDVIGAN
jgi:peptidoglycan/xylan/chitin deacetylase (PgdA/CDA1 family)